MKAFKILSDSTIALLCSSLAAGAILEEKKKSHKRFDKFNRAFQKSIAINVNNYGVHILEEDTHLYAAMSHILAMDTKKDNPIAVAVAVEIEIKEDKANTEEVEVGLPDLEKMVLKLKAEGARLGMSEEKIAEGIKKAEKLHAILTKISEVVKQN